MLTDVEGCVLGVIWQRKLCTAYEVRREFVGSSTPRWSSSGGSIYPVLERLQGRRLVRGKAEAWGPRERTRFSLTARGLAALRSWVGPPVGPELGGPSYDPLRTRSCFLGAMPRAARARWVQSAIAETRRALEAVRERSPHPDVFEAFSLRGSTLELEARLRWLEDFADHPGITGVGAAPAARAPRAATSSPRRSPRSPRRPASRRRRYPDRDRRHWSSRP